MGWSGLPAVIACGSPSSGRGSKDFQVQLLVELGLGALDGGGEQLVGEVRHDAVVARGVLQLSS